MHLDELAELVGNAVLIALDDRGVRDRQSQWPAKQGHDGIPVGEAADGRGFGKGCDKAECRMHMQQSFGCDKQCKRARQHQRGQRLDAPQLGGSHSVAGSVERKCAGGGHEGCRTLPSFAAKLPRKPGPLHNANHGRSLKSICCSVVCFHEPSQISISVPNSTTCLAGTPKKAAEPLALCCRNAKRVSRQTAMPATSSLGMIVSRPT